ncbi:MAG TPA: ethanolamine ammonia-lyase subunit EutC [Candidatus Binataceae bacterium]|nr:ethanolamine ammonia-lyase subunit EutC [Candidatus Binataceae bacterium]
MADDFDALRRATPARLGVGRAGPRYTTAAMLEFRADHARAVDAVLTELPSDWPRKNGLVEIHSEAGEREEYLRHPERGRRIVPADIPRVKLLQLKIARGKAVAKPTVMLLVGDGLSSAAVAKNAGPLLRSLTRSLAKNYRLFKPVFVRNARVRIEDHVGELLRPDIVCMIVGERPGLLTAESLSAYVIYRPTLKSLEPDRTVISNIHGGGITIPEAARKITTLIDDAIRHRATGATLAEATAPPPA